MTMEQWDISCCKYRKFILTEQFQTDIGLFNSTITDIDALILQCVAGFKTTHEKRGSI